MILCCVQGLVDNCGTSTALQLPRLSQPFSLTTISLPAKPNTKAQQQQQPGPGGLGAATAVGGLGVLGGMGAAGAMGGGMSGMGAMGAGALGGAAAGAGRLMRLGEAFAIFCTNDGVPC